MNITKIKNMLEENSSKNVRFKFNGNRNQIEEFDGRIINTYKYLISTNTINKMIYNIDSDFEEVPNDIDIVLDNNSGTNTIKFKLDSFCKLNNKCNESLQIEASYEMFNSVKEIGNPIK